MQISGVFQTVFGTTKMKNRTRWHSNIRMKDPIYGSRAYKIFTDDLNALNILQQHEKEIIVIDLIEDFERLGTDGTPGRTVKNVLCNHGTIWVQN